VRSVRATAALLALPVLAVTLSACGSAASAPVSAPAGATTKRLQIVTTVAPITSITANVAGDRADITGIVPEGTNSHTFEPPPSAAEALGRADVVLVNGLKLEDPTLELARKVSRRGAEIVELGTTVLPESEWIYDFSFPKEEGKPNPHLWTDPTYAIRYAEVVRDVLSRRDPGNAATYARNTSAFIARASALSDAIRTATATVPESRRRLLTYHDAYAYFARTYGWKVIGAVQPADFEDPTPKEVARIIDQVRRERVPTVFGSEVFPSPVLERIGKETGARYEDTLRDDDLPGRQGEPEHSWLGLMRYDYVTMVRGLGGDPSALEGVPVGDVAPDRAVYPQ
jgi:ABC-type Zn uptake system ZnuABC Zn-binding protein ZnuA